MLTQSQKEQIFYLCKDNETLRDIFNQYCHSIDDELGHLNQMIRNEISVLAASTEMLVQQNPSLKHQTQWAMIEEEYENLYRLMANYESYRSNFRMKNTYVDVVELCVKIASKFQSTASERNIDFLFENQMTHPQILHHYFGDAEKIEDAIIGLLKHAFYNTPNVTYVRFCLRNEDETKAVIHVECDGLMIPKHELQDLQRLQISRTLYRKHIGILTAKHFAESCCYDFTISSSEEKTYVEFGMPTLAVSTL